MSPLLQKRRPPQSPDPPISSDQRPQNRSPQSWFRSANSPSLSSLARTQHPHRTFGFSSVRELARSSSRQTLRTLPTTTFHHPYSHGCSPPKDGGLRHTNAAEDSESQLPSNPGLQQSRDSSVESFTVDKSGTSNDSTYATTPSPVKHRAFQLLDSKAPVRRKSMGNKVSTVLRKPIPLEGKQNSATISSDPANPPGPSHQQGSSEQVQPAILPARASSVIFNVPRRRSSLTALHLDSSHFETPDPRLQKLQHRASTLTEPRRRPSNLADVERPITTIMMSSDDAAPEIRDQKREAQSPAFLSPPLLSPALSNSQLSSASSRAPSFNSRKSAVPISIHLPKTFPDGPIPVLAPPLTVIHYKCYQSHRRILLSRNKVNPVPCMTCGEAEGEARWKCIWCALRICGVCMAEFDAKHRSLEKFVAWLEKDKEGGRAKDVIPELSSGEQIEVKTENVPIRRESQRLDSAAMVKLLKTSK